MELPELKALAEHVLAAEDADVEAEVSVAFVGTETIQRLNRDYRRQDEPTDVLAFDLSENEEEGRLFGEIVIAPAVAEKQAREAGVSLMEELRLLLTHGLLHVLGYDHQDEESHARMEARQRELLDTFRGTASAS